MKEGIAFTDPTSGITHDMPAQFYSTVAWYNRWWILGNMNTVIKVHVLVYNKHHKV